MRLQKIRLHLSVLALLFATSIICKCQDNYEIQVYGSETVGIGRWAPAFPLSLATSGMLIRRTPGLSRSGPLSISKSGSGISHSIQRSIVRCMARVSHKASPSLRISKRVTILQSASTPVSNITARPVPSPVSILFAINSSRLCRHSILISGRIGNVNFGVGVGVTHSTDHLIVKMIVGRRFDFLLERRERNQ
jgi:hypothetical protein